MTEVRHRNVALILARELAVNLATPMCIYDETSSLVYLNEKAEAIIGRYKPDDGVALAQLGRDLQPEDLDGSPVDPDELPSAIVLRERKPAHRVMRVTVVDGSRRTMAVTSIPLFVRADEFVGAFAVFWELPDDEV
jgi:PAS domain-containing protein